MQYACLNKYAFRKDVATLYYKKGFVIALCCLQAARARDWAQKTASTTMPNGFGWSQQNNQRQWGGSLAIQSL